MLVTTPTLLTQGHPSFEKEGKLLIYSIITLLSSSKEQYFDGNTMGGDENFSSKNSIPVKYFKGIFPVILIITSLLNSAWSQQINYQDLFGDDWKKAQVFEKENRRWMEPILDKNHLSYPLSIAIIFPELVRYSALRDKMEITLLKALYVNLGEDYANFSIGQFQMKPSFAEIIRERAPFVMGRRSGITFKRVADFDDIKEYRKSIVTDLEDIKVEFQYLVVFIKICEKSYKTNRMDDISALKFLATTYNYGIDKTADQIASMIEKKFFNTKLFKTENYSYADVSLYWYRQFLKEK